MFKDARALDRQRTDASLRLALRRYAEANEHWFDGSIGSIDRRLDHCTRLLHSARTIVGRLSISEASRYLCALNQLDADHLVLTGMKDDLLTGCANRTNVVGPPGWRL